jgi:hypothetical protein
VRVGIKCSALNSLPVSIIVCYAKAMNPSHTATFPPLDWADSLSRDVVQEIALVLHGALPWSDVDEPDGKARRDQAAMAAVAALLPANAAEARLATQFVIADAWAMDYLRLAAKSSREFEVARQHRARALSQLRESKDSLQLLLQLQAGRRAMEAAETQAGKPRAPTRAQHRSDNGGSSVSRLEPTLPGSPVRRVLH